MIAQTKRLFFHDEAPAIGCGWRTVEISTGRKWVRVRNPRTGAVNRIFLKAWLASGIERGSALNIIRNGNGAPALIATPRMKLPAKPRAKRSRKPATAAVQIPLFLQVSP